MRNVLLSAFMMLLCTSMFAQANQDSVYFVVDQMPRFPGCEAMTGPEKDKDSCAQQRMMEYLYGSIQYPDEARRNGNEGTAVISFVVEKNGTISDAIIAKDVAGGCGVEALRVVKQMNEVGVRWKPGQMAGKTVRVKLSLPVKFKLEETKPYSIIDGDSIYLAPDVQSEFVGGDSAFVKVMSKVLKYPAAYKDSCFVGALDANVIVFPDGHAKVLDLIDYSSLGVDFQYESIAFIQSLGKQWTPGVYHDQKVTTTATMRVIFKSKSSKCSVINNNFDKADAMVEEGMKLYDGGKKDAALPKLNDAIALFPDDMEYLYMRGMLYLNNNKFPEACQDLTVVKSRLMVTWFDNILNLICRPQEAPVKEEAPKK